MEVTRTPTKQVTREKRTRRRRRISMSWMIMKRAISSSSGDNKKKDQNRHLRLLRLNCVSSVVMSPIRVSQEPSQLNHEQTTYKANKNGVAPRPGSLAHKLRITYAASDFVDRIGAHMTPTRSPKEDISAKWRDMHGLNDWDSLLNPLHPWLRREILKYGEFAEATYDAFDFDPFSNFCGSCRYNPSELFDKLGLIKHGYKVTKYIYAMSHVDVPSWFENSDMGEIWSRDSNWMGFVAVSTDEESRRIGRRDIVVAWRGTVAPSEWFSDLKAKLKHIGGEEDHGNIKVEDGFLSIYKSKSEKTRYNTLSACEQVMKELTKLVNYFKLKRSEEEISITITGHSLGGALALLNAYDAATSFPGIFVSVVSFGAPRVGNLAFKEKLNEMGVKTLRVVVKQDIVPRLPGIIVLNNMLRKMNYITSRFNWVYRHVGSQLELDVLRSPYLKKDFDLCGFHNLETYLHLVDGYLDVNTKYRWNARRDVALVNKTSDMLIEELRIPENWYQLPNKGLVMNSYGRWVKPSRKPADYVPSSPFMETPTHA